MPYGLIAELAAFGMTAWFVFVGEASTRAKLVVSAILLLTLAVPRLMPGWKQAASSSIDLARQLSPIMRSNWVGAWSANIFCALSVIER